MIINIFNNLAGLVGGVNQSLPCIKSEKEILKVWKQRATN